MTTPDRVHNPLTGEQISFDGADAQGAGDELAFHVALRPLGMAGGVPHRHLPTEEFEVLSGRLLVFIAGRRPLVARAGDTFEIPSRHWHWIVAPGRARARVVVRPAMHFDEMLACQAAVGSGDIGAQTLRRLNELMREHECAPRLPTAPARADGGVRAPRT
jgi:mannose-6-phosphate isomerase-like protein (cupin superfamily)